MPVVSALRSQYLKPQHWAKIRQVLKFPVGLKLDSKSFLLKDLMKYSVIEHQEIIVNIATEAI